MTLVPGLCLQPGTDGAKGRHCVRMEPTQQGHLPGRNQPGKGTEHAQ